MLILYLLNIISLARKYGAVLTKEINAVILVVFPRSPKEQF